MKLSDVELDQEDLDVIEIRKTAPKRHKPDSDFPDRYKIREINGHKLTDEERYQLTLMNIRRKRKIWEDLLSSENATRKQKNIAKKEIERLCDFSFAEWMIESESLRWN